MNSENLSAAEIASLQAPLTDEEMLQEAKLSAELVKQLSIEEKKLLCRIPPKKWPKALIEKAKHYIDLQD